MPLTVESSKPRLCHDERFLNLWIVDLPFSLDKLTDLPRYVDKNHFQTVFDDKSGYDHVFLTARSRSFFGFQWAGWYFCYKTLPFGWKASASLYHTIGLAATSYIRSLGIPCSQYIDDRHIGQIRLRRPRSALATWSNFQLAEAAAFIACSVLIELGYFIGLKKSIFVPQLVVPFLGYLSDSSRQAFLLPDDKRAKFIALRESILAKKSVSLVQLQKFAGKTLSFILVVPAAQLYSRAIFTAISKAHSTGRPVPLSGALLQEILHWRFLDSWTGFLPWKSEFHYSLRLVSDASNTGWGCVVYFPDETPTRVHGLWSVEERAAPIALRETLALQKALTVATRRISNAKIDCYVDNQVLVNCWQKGGSKAPLLTEALKNLFHIALKYNLTLQLYFIPSLQNEADGLSRRLSDLDCTLSPKIWRLVDRSFGPHSVDLMAIPANVMRDASGHPLKFFSRFPLQEAAGTNVFSQTLSPSDNAYVFPPFVLVGPLLRFLSSQPCSVSLVVPDLCPRRFWWPILLEYSSASICLGIKGATDVLLFPASTPSGFAPQPLQWDLWVFHLTFP